MATLYKPSSSNVSMHRPIAYKKLFESSPALFLVLSEDLTILAASDAYLNATFTKRENIVGRKVFEVFPDNPDDLSADGVSNLQASLERVIATKKPDYMPIIKYDIRNPDKDGSAFEQHYWTPVNFPVLDSNQQIQYIVNKVEDVTDYVQLKNAKQAQKKISEELRIKAEKSELEIFAQAREIHKMNVELVAINLNLANKEKQLTQARDILQKELATGQKDILDLARELTIRSQELQKTMSLMKDAKDSALNASAVKSQFLANMSHEIRTPLGIILGFTELLLDQRISSEEREIFVKRIRDSGQHLLELLSEILDLTKIEAGHLDVELSNVSILNLIDQVKSVMEPMARRKGLNLSFKIPEQLPEFFKTDQTKVRQVLFNLISNAIKFCDEGSVEVEVKLSSTMIPPEIEFHVRDTGPGIPNNYLDHLFEAFTQGDNSMERTHGGSGLGLALSRRLARALDGDVELISTSSAGSEFCAHFALHGNVETSETEKNVVPLFKKKPTDPNSIKGVRILVVDDSPDNLELVRFLLEKAGATVETANDGVEGVKKAMGNQYDITLMDIQMPKLNGYEATSMLRAKGYDKPIIALTAHAMKEDQEKCIDSGCDAYLAKPIVVPTLISTIQKNIGHHRSHPIIN